MCSRYVFGCSLSRVMILTEARTTPRRLTPAPTRPREHGVPCQPARLNVAAAQEESTCRMGGAGPRRAATAAPRPRRTRPATTSPRHVPSARRSVAGARAPSGAARHGCPGGCAVPAAAAAAACWADIPVAAKPGLRGGRVRGCGLVICSITTSWDKLGVREVGGDSLGSRSCWVAHSAHFLM